MKIRLNRVKEAIRDKRIQNGWNQEAMAEQLQISQSTYAKIENGQLIPKIDRLQQIANILEIDLLTLLNSTDNTSTANPSGSISNQNKSIADVEILRQIIQEELQKLKN